MGTYKCTCTSNVVHYWIQATDGGRDVQIAVLFTSLAVFFSATLNSWPFFHCIRKTVWICEVYSTCMYMYWMPVIVCAVLTFSLNRNLYQILHWNVQEFWHLLVSRHPLWSALCASDHLTRSVLVCTYSVHTAYTVSLWMNSVQMPDYGCWDDKTTETDVRERLDFCSNRWMPKDEKIEDGLVPWQPAYLQITAFICSQLCIISGIKHLWLYWTLPHLKIKSIGIEDNHRAPSVTSHVA